jgi:hypothetical protein
MQAWIPFAVTVVALAAILAPFLQRRHLLLLAIAAATGILASLLADRLVQPRAPADMQQVLYLVAILPLPCVVAAILSYAWPWKAWQWGLVPYLAAALWQIVGPSSTITWGNLGPIPYVFPFYAAVLLAIPAILIALLTARFARRRLDHGKH